MNNFSYGSILIAFALERIPLMQPQHVTLGVASPRDSRMQQWVDLMSRHAGQSTIIFSTAFFSWLDPQQIVFEEHPYSEMDFRGDLDLILLVGAQWGAIGKSFTKIFFDFQVSTCFCVFDVFNTKLKSFSCMQMWVFFNL